jgi:leucyl-tRNA synthetase
MSVERYNARTAEIRWQQAWRTQSVFAARDEDPGRRYHMPEMVPLASGRLDMSHVRNCVMADVVARYKRANGFSVLPPMEQGADGMPAEHAAMAGNALKSLGLSYDWSHAIAARDSEAAPAEPGDADPDDIIDTYGADATRWFVLSDSPPDRSMVWTEAGIHGAWRFVQRLWRIINSAGNFSEGAPAATPPALSGPALRVRKTAHRALARVSGNVERRRFNVCVAGIYTFARALETAVADSAEPAGPDLKFAAREAAEIMVQLFHPLMPHLAEECWAALGHKSLLAARRWPMLDAGVLTQGAVTLPVHVNGRRRADVTVARDARNGDIEASVLALDVVRRALDGKAPRKVIIVPQRIINVVA